MDSSASTCILRPKRRSTRGKHDRTHLALLAALGAMAATPLRAETPTADIAARIELRAIPTQTLSDREFLTGKDGKPATVTGELRIAQGTGRLPVVVLMHGSGGMSAGIDSWSRMFNAMGVSTFALDGFTGRGITSVSHRPGAARPAQLHPRSLRRAGDAGQASARRSAAHRPDGLLARRAGGAVRQPSSASTSSGTSRAPSSRPTSRSIRTARRATSTIPMSWPRRSASSTASPTTIIRSPPARRFVERLKAAGRDVVLTEYPDAQHGFDTPLGSGPVVSKGASDGARLLDRREGRRRADLISQ